MDLETLASLDSWDVEDADHDISSVHHSSPQRQRARRKRSANDDYTDDGDDGDDYEERRDNGGGRNKEATHAAEEFKVRYNVLRDMYEKRLRGLVTQMHTVYADTARDAAVQALGENEDTRAYQPLRRQEVVQEAIESDAERSYLKAAHTLAKTESALHRANRKIDELNRKVRARDRDRGRDHDRKDRRSKHHSNTTTTTDEELEEFRRWSQEKKQQQHQEQQQHHEEEDETKKKSGEDGAAEADKSSPTLLLRLERAERMVETKEREMKEMRNKRGRHEGGGGGKSRDKSRDRSRDKRRQRRRGSDESDTDSMVDSDADFDSEEGGSTKRRSAPVPVEVLQRHPVYVALKSKAERAGRLLAQSERERLELRQKYMAIGQNVEQLIKTDAMSTSEEVTRLSNRCMKLKTRLETTTKRAKGSSRTQHEKMKILSLRMEEMTARERELSEHARTLESEMIELRVEKGTSTSLKEELEKARYVFLFYIYFYYIFLYFFMLELTPVIVSLFFFSFSLTFTLLSPVASPVLSCALLCSPVLSLRCRIVSLETTVVNIQSEESSKLDVARIEAREEQASRLTDAEVRCAKLESEMIRVRSEQDERLKQTVERARMETQQKYEMLVEEKLTSLKNVHENTLR